MSGIYWFFASRGNTKFLSNEKNNQNIDRLNFLQHFFCKGKHWWGVESRKIVAKI
jgi:hypothetical protein